MPLITLTTDFGDADGFVGVLKGVIAGICPGAGIIDLAHSIPAGDIVGAAYVLRNSYLYFPPGTIHFAVVDPGVGGVRRAVVMQAVEQFFVAPDNGLLAWVVREVEAAGEEICAWSLEDERFHLSPVSSTFHGRDIFAPAAAFLAQGVDPAELGPELKASLEPEGELSGGPVIDLLRSPGDPEDEGRIIHIDRFGNCVTTIVAAVLPGEVIGGEREGIFEVETAGGKQEVRGLLPSYDSVEAGEAVVVEGSGGLVEIAVSGGSAAGRLGLRRGDRVRFRLC